MLVIMMVRRLTYNMLTLYRSVTLRSVKSRAQLWGQLIRTCYNAMIMLTKGGVTGIRRRATVTD
jgi:hypothetical protein